MRVILTGKQPELERMLYKAMDKSRDKKQNKKPKGDALHGEYCPKKKAGQSWAHTKENRDVEVTNIEDDRSAEAWKEQ